jgi:hypothetical protein
MSPKLMHAAVRYWWHGDIESRGSSLKKPYSGFNEADVGELEKHAFTALQAQ